MTDIYRPPDSDVTASNKDEYDNINVFKRANIWLTILLTFITLGLYFLYWLHTRTKKLNLIVHHQLSAAFTGFAALLYLLTFLLNILQVFVEVTGRLTDLLPYFTFFQIADLVSSILMLVWIFMFRGRLQEGFSSQYFHMGLVLTFFFQIFYLQYKINELIDIAHNKQMQTDAAKATPLIWAL